MSEIVRLRTVYEGYSKIMAATVRTADGQEIEREIEDHGAAVSFLPYDPARRTALLVKLFRAPVLHAGGGRELLETPAGMIDEGETPDVAARREAMEETGLKLGELDYVASVFSSAGVSSEVVTLYLAPYAADDRVGEGGGAPGENEAIEVIELPLAELWRMVERAQIADMKTLTLLAMLKLRRPDLFELG
jgi:nudix-type nucleoside diphosphatase (YffH/AdpP family)